MSSSYILPVIFCVLAHEVWEFFGSKETLPETPVTEICIEQWEETPCTNFELTTWIEQQCQ